MLIAIPSRGRWLKQETLKWLPGYFLNKAILFVPYHEGYQYRREHSQVMDVPAEFEGIGKTRQYICDYAKRVAGETKVLMLDDDLVFAARRDDEPTKFRQAYGTDVLNALFVMDTLLNHYAMVHMAHREGANWDTDPVTYNTRALRVLGYRIDVLEKECIRFDNLKVMEDFDVQLSLLTRGYKTACLNTHVHNQFKSGAEGGCSVYRTGAIQQQAAVALATKYPKFVKTVTKKGWGDDLFRTDVKIAWKRAYDSAPEKRTPRVLDDREGGHPSKQGGGVLKTLDEG